MKDQIIDFAMRRKLEGNLGNNSGSLWIPNDDIGVAADGDSSFTRINVEDFGGVR